MSVAAPLRRTETGYLVTELVDTSAGLRLLRRPGVARSARTPSPAAVGSIRARSVPGIIWSPPVESGALAQNEAGVECFVLPGPASVATLALGGMPPAAVANMLSPVGAALAAVHALPASSGRRPAGLERLHAWLTTGRAPGAGERLHAELLARPELRAFAVASVEDVLAAPARCALGAPGQSVLYPHPDGSATTVLLTDELGDAPAEWDLGWLLGELLELLNPPAHVPEPRSLAGFPPAEAVMDAYGGSFDRSRLARVCLLRWLVHLHDYASYVAWDDDLRARLDRIGEFAADPALVLAPAAGP